MGKNRRHKHSCCRETADEYGSASKTLACTATEPTQPKEPTFHTIKANNEVKEALPFEDKTDFVNATKNFRGRDPHVKIMTDADDEVVSWDLTSFQKFINIQAESPESVNPSLWRNSQLCLLNGVFQVHENIYQVRGYDLSNITFVLSDEGWIVFDPLITEETARAAFQLIKDKVGQSDKIRALIYSHSHVDHFGGARGLLTDDELLGDDVDIIGPEDFVEHAVSENVIAGNVMSRRAVYMYGSALQRSAKGTVCAGLGMTTSTGSVTMIPPKTSINRTPSFLKIANVVMNFQFTPGTEAPTEMNTYFPQWKCLWMAENSTQTMHNILTLRGAQVRDSLKWAKYLQESIDMFGDKVEVKFQSHHWPTWGNENIREYFIKQRDCYKYMHDQTVRLMNMGYTGEEISETIRFPESLEKNWSTRQYYGTLSHNTRAIYQFYMGWYSGNPSDLNNLPPRESAINYVRYMGGAQSVIDNALDDYHSGNYRWVAQVLKHVVFLDTDNYDAKELLADAYEQLGYQAESGAWRCSYLQGAYELRNGLPNATPVVTASDDIIRNMSVSMLLDYLGVRLNAEKAEGLDWNMQINLTDISESYNLTITNSTLNYTKELVASPMTDVTMTKAILDNIQLGVTDFETALADGEITISPPRSKIFERFVGMLDTFEFWFNIVTPRPVDPEFTNSKKNIPGGLVKLASC